jgi:hypothetical protein
MWTEQNMLKIDMEVVVCDVEQCTVERVMVPSIWHEEEERMYIGCRYGCAFCEVMQSSV